MSISAHMIRISLASWLIPLAWFGIGEFPALAGVEKPKKEMRQLWAQPLQSERQMPRAEGKARSKKPTKKSVYGNKMLQAKSTKSHHGVMPQSGPKKGSSGE